MELTASSATGKFVALVPSLPAASEESQEEPSEDDPFGNWPEAESATVIEDLPDEGVSVEHVSVVVSRTAFACQARDGLYGWTSREDSAMAGTRSRSVGCRSSFAIVNRSRFRPSAARPVTS